MKRYNRKALYADLVRLNEILAKHGHDMLMIGGRRYGYSAIDLATKEQAARHCCQRMLFGGTPRECLAAAQSYVLQHI